VPHDTFAFVTSNRKAPASITRELDSSLPTWQSSVIFPAYWGTLEDNVDNEAGIRKPHSSGATPEALGTESRSPTQPIQVAGSSCRTFGLWKDNGLS
jgi:hypothetical protein